MADLNEIFGSDSENEDIGKINSQYLSIKSWPCLPFK